MGKVTITEAQLTKMVSNSIKKALNEIGDTADGQYKLGRLHQKRYDTARNYYRKMDDAETEDERDKYAKERSKYMKRSMDAYKKAEDERDSQFPNGGPVSRYLKNSFHGGASKQEKKDRKK